MTFDAYLDKFKKLAAAQEERDKRSRICCENCAWFAAENDSRSTAGRCLRFPPAACEEDEDEKGLSDAIRGSVPVVCKTWLCGEFMHKKTGDTPYQNGERVVGMLRARVAELEDQIDRLRMQEGDA